LAGLCFFLPGVLAEVQQDWNHESLDGIYPSIAKKVVRDEAEIYGLCRLITDQTLTPIQIQLQLDEIEDEVSWLALRIGEISDGKLIRRRNEFIGKYALPSSPESIDWAYRVGFGTRRL
jgi:hypothetical protein